MSIDASELLRELQSRLLILPALLKQIVACPGSSQQKGPHGNQCCGHRKKIIVQLNSLPWIQGVQLGLHLYTAAATLTQTSDCAGKDQVTVSKVNY